MQFVIFTHSLVSDWNHGNAHFLRGIATELVERGHGVRIFEPRDGWSVTNLVREHGEAPLLEFSRFYPRISSMFYNESAFDMARALDGADVALVHEWNSPDVVRRAGEYRARHPELRLYFHDTHHRSVTDPAAMSRYDLRHYDGVLAYGRVIAEKYKRNAWSANAWTWHEAADTRIFYPRDGAGLEGDLVWIGNWGDEERSREIREFLIEPVRALRLKAKVYGVRYPQHALDELAAAGIQYGGWLPNYRVPEVFARYRVTVHIPRRPYVESLPGIPTIRPFEALACGIPLVSAPWRDYEQLFRPGLDFLFARDGHQMRSHLGALLRDPDLAAEIAQHGLDRIRARHTCAHRTDELLALAGTDMNAELVQGAH